MSGLLEDLKDPQSAEEFLDYFNVVFERRVVNVHRLTILNGARGLIDEAAASSLSDSALFERFRRRLQDAYAACRDGNFTSVARSVAPPESACTESTLPPGTVFIPIEAVMGVRRLKRDGS